MFDDYEEAYAFARERARKYDRDQGIRKVREYGKTRYNVTFLPHPDKCFGDDSRAKRVTPNALP